MKEPIYKSSAASGHLREKVDQAMEMLRSCELCPRRCKVDRTEGADGVCRTRRYAKVSSFNAHFGEESVLVGSGGSGTIFFTNCSLGCSFCQNFEISRCGEGGEASPETLARMMLELQERGCENINFVTPSHVVPQILEAVLLAEPQGLSLPLVYNTSCYDEVETLLLLEGVIDIYMPDFKFWSPATAEKTCNAVDYPEIAKAALREMHRQVGDLQVDERGIAYRGVLIRHLVLPNALADTREVMRFIAKEISKQSFVNIMPQYRPCGDAHKLDELARPLQWEEFAEARKAAIEEGITRLG